MICTIDLFAHHSVSHWSLAIWIQRQNPVDWKSLISIHHMNHVIFSLRKKGTIGSEQIQVLCRDSFDTQSKWQVNEGCKAKVWELWEFRLRTFRNIRSGKLTKTSSYLQLESYQLHLCMRILVSVLQQSNVDFARIRAGKVVFEGLTEDVAFMISDSEDDRGKSRFPTQNSACQRRRLFKDCLRAQRMPSVKMVISSNFLPLWIVFLFTC
jgi:hypothetical protein